MVGRAGGEDVLGRQGESSFKVTSEEIAATNAEIIIIMLSGYDAARNAAEFQAVQLPDSWQKLLRAATNGSLPLTPTAIPHGPAPPC